MTRINTTTPITLCDQHLLAEIRELPRILNKAKQGKYKSKPIDKFTLNKGHELSLVNKLKWLVERHKLLILEAKERGFDVMDYSSSYKNLPQHLYNDWKPTQEAKQLIKDRITKRLSTMKVIRWYGEKVTKEFFN